MTKHINAAGGLIIDDDGLIVVVHRPRYDDWSLPKGKLEAGESFEDGAVREVHEETALRCTLGELLGDEHYTDRKGRPKTVRWWRMTIDADDGFTPNDEVDELRRVGPEEAAGLLSYAADRALVARCTA